MRSNPQKINYLPSLRRMMEGAGSKPLLAGGAAIFCVWPGI